MFIDWDSSSVVVLLESFLLVYLRKATLAPNISWDMTRPPHAGPISGGVPIRKVVIGCSVAVRSDSSSLSLMKGALR
jgi:hypothetical protein